LNRELSGIFVRVKVNEKWDNMDITDCDEDQITEILRDRGPQELVKWLSRIAKQYNAMLKASDIDLEEVSEDLVTDCLKKFPKEELLRSIVMLCKVYKMTGDVFDIRRGLS
jgi:hypothetical protein